MNDQRSLAFIVLIFTAFLFWLHTQGKLFDLFGVFFGEGANSAGSAITPHTGTSAPAAETTHSVTSVGAQSEADAVAAAFDKAMGK